MNRLDDALAAYETVIREHPQNVVAKNGRAEVLRDLNRLDDALAAYDTATREHPQNIVAKYGRANLLGRLGRFKEALELLPKTTPKSQQDWIGFNTRGKIFLQMGNLSEAASIFETGTKALLPRRIAAYFQTAYAFCHLQSNTPQKAIEIMKVSADMRLKRAQRVIRSHALGALGKTEECRLELEPLRVLPSPRIVVTIFEIDARYVRNNPQRTETWLFQQEQELVLTA